MGDHGLGCERSGVQIPGGTPFLEVSVSNEIGYHGQIVFNNM